MKTKILPAAAAFLFGLASHQPAVGQGALDPTGPPAPSMRTLLDIEPRIPIRTAPFTITSPGSYYLAQNLTVTGGDGVVISADNVTLDLNGFTISSTASPAAGTGVLLYLGGRKNITIRNGIIRSGVTYDGGAAGDQFTGPGFVNGIVDTDAGPFSMNVRVLDITVQGVDLHGILLDQNSATVSRCVVRTAGGYGIRAGSASDCTADECGSAGIFALNASNCVGTSTITSGISAENASNCSGVSYGGAGLQVTNASNCRGFGISGADGIVAVTAINCHGSSDTGARGILATSVSNCAGTSDSGAGIEATVVSNSYGYSNSGVGILGSSVTNCRGESDSESGIYSDNASGSTGTSSSGYGLRAENATLCSGVTSTGLAALKTVGTANSCSATHLGTGTAISAFIAIGCTSNLGSFSIAYPYLMP